MGLDSRRLNRRQQVAPGTARPAAARGTGHCLGRQCRQKIRREACGFEEIGNSNLWFPISCAVRRQQVAPGTARRQQHVAPGTARRRQ